LRRHTIHRNCEFSMEDLNLLNPPLGAIRFFFYYRRIDARAYACNRMHMHAIGALVNYGLFVCVICYVLEYVFYVFFRYKNHEFYVFLQLRI